MKNFVKLLICFCIISGSYGSLQMRDTGWAGRFNEDYIQEKLMKEVQSDFAKICNSNDKIIDYQAKFQIIKNESPFSSFNSNNIYDYKIGVEYLDYYTDELVFTQFRVLTTVGPITGKVIVHYVDEPEYRCSAY